MEVHIFGWGLGFREFLIFGYMEGIQGRHQMRGVGDFNIRGRDYAEWSWGWACILQ